MTTTTHDSLSTITQDLRNCSHRQQRIQYWVNLINVKSQDSAFQTHHFQQMLQWFRKRSDLNLEQLITRHKVLILLCIRNRLDLCKTLLYEVAHHHISHAASWLKRWFDGQSHCPLSGEFGEALTKLGCWAVRKGRADIIEWLAQHPETGYEALPIAQALAEKNPERGYTWLKTIRIHIQQYPHQFSLTPQERHYTQQMHDLIEDQFWTSLVERHSPYIEQQWPHFSFSLRLALFFEAGRYQVWSLVQAFIRTEGLAHAERALENTEVVSLYLEPLTPEEHSTLQHYLLTQRDHEELTLTLHDLEVSETRGRGRL